MRDATPGRAESYHFKFQVASNCQVFCPNLVTNFWVLGVSGLRGARTSNDFEMGSMMFVSRYKWRGESQLITDKEQQEDGMGERGVCRQR